MEFLKDGGNIKAINKNTVHRICSGQVVLNLATAVKELIENSLDAGASVIDIKLKEYGSEVVEVVDNGVGVHPSNFEGLTLKHHTSKLRDFSDLISVETFGFRGEALSSLCALSELCIVTRHESESCGTALYFDKNGVITDRKQLARQIGTTVTLSNLFGTLPVRQKEFHKNLKREFNKMTQLLSAYCLVSTGVKLTCVNQTKNNTRTTFLSTQGCKTVKENISCLFGAKQLSNLLEIKPKVPSGDILVDLQVTEEDFSIFTLEGYISSCGHGSGRGSSDRQFYFVNSRPCEPTKIMKHVNEVYHQFNAHQYPFVFLNINVSKGLVDVNVTPDKRKIFLTEEKLLLALLKSSIINLFEKIPSTFTYNNVSLLSNQTPKSQETCKPNFNKFDSWRHKSEGKRRNDVCLDDKFPKKQMKTESKNYDFVNQFSIQKTTEKIVEKVTEIQHNSVNPSKSGVIDINNSENIYDNVDCKTNKDLVTKSNIYHRQPNDSEQDTLELNMGAREDHCHKNSDDSDLLVDSDFSNAEGSKPVVHETRLSPLERISIPEEPLSIVDELSENVCENSFSLENALEQEKISLNINSDKPVDNLPLVEFDEFEERGVRSVRVDVDLDSVKKSLHERISKFNFSKEAPKVRFRAVIDPSKNQQAEKELSKEISKEMFEKMEIIGQFNLGFIITKLGSDLFMIDQHATDEKYNFETLQQTTVISNQKLVSPQVLELTAANECVVMENINIFNKNGFEFSIDEKAPTTKRISLTAIPMSKNWVFGKDDIDELIFMLQDSPGANCRPSRVRAMFASRACRKSVMIGMALEERDMRKLINNMGTIEQPWNCPHGRPTMRHLVNLDLISSSSD